MRGRSPEFHHQHLGSAASPTVRVVEHRAVEDVASEPQRQSHTEYEEDIEDEQHRVLRSEVVLHVERSVLR